ncbi:MAG: hypothetical protein ACRCWJ_08305 [Casimicrobium sp.]
MNELRASDDDFIAFAKPVDKPSETVMFDFRGHSMSKAEAPVFAVSNSSEPPKEFRPIFSKGFNNWSKSYPLQAMPITAAKYYYIGDYVDYIEPETRKKVDRILITQYEMRNTNEVRIFFDTEKSANAFKAKGALSAETLSLENFPLGHRFQRKSRETRKYFDEEVYKKCAAIINPELQKSPPEMMKPIKRFLIDPDQASGNPYFSKEPENPPGRIKLNGGVG